MSQYGELEDLEATGLPPRALEEVVSVDDFLTKASATIDSYLRRRYTLPLATTPPEIADACIAIASYRLLVFRGFNPDEYDANFKARNDFYLGAPGMKGWLDKLADGSVVLDGAIDATPGTPTTGGPRTPKVYSRSSRGWYDTGDGSV